MFNKTRILITILLSAIITLGLSCSSKHTFSNNQKIKVAGDSSHVLFCPSVIETAIKLFNKGTEFEADGNYDNAIDNYLLAIILDSSFCDAMDNLARLYRVKGKYEDAIRWNMKSLKIYPENSIALQNLAVVYSLTGKIDEAITKYKLLKTLYPDNPEGYYGLGSCYTYTGEYKKAIIALKKSEEIYKNRNSPWISDARHKLGLCYFFTDDYTKCIQYLKSIFPEYSNDMMLNFALGASYLTEGNYDFGKALKYISKADSLGFDIPEDIKNILENSSN